MLGASPGVGADAGGGAAGAGTGPGSPVMSLRNIGAGIGVCQAWSVRPGLQRRVNDHVPEDEFRVQGRDLYIPAGDVGLWQGAIRDASDPSIARLPTRLRAASRWPSSSSTQTRSADSARSAASA